MARLSLMRAASDWGRGSSNLEKLVLDMAEADAEGGFLSGGLGHVAKNLYNRCQEQAVKLLDADHRQIIIAHCLAGLAKLALSGSLPQDDGDESLRPVPSLSEEFARLSLREADMLSAQGENSLYLGSSDSLHLVKAFHKSLARQLVADSLLRSGCTKDAEEFLEAAIKDTPQDFDAALALGAFRMRTAFFPATGMPPSSDKVAQTQLLKAAKLNPSEPSSFALLGFWYEEKGDTNRAIGCFSRALAQDPSQPVAGRGLLRLRSYENETKVCDAAVNTTSPLNGWAWKAMGFHKAMVDADDNVAVICLQESIRCKDISFPHNESMSIFYKRSQECRNGTSEIVEVWSGLAACYRRLGRLSAAIKAFEAAWSLSAEDLPAIDLVSWAQVQLELGLVKDSVETFRLALEKDDKSVSQMASYGLGCALLALTQRDLQDGKATFAYQSLVKAVLVVTDAFFTDQKRSGRFLCAMKLLGDMHTFGAQLPPHVFDDTSNLTDDPFERSMSHLRSQIAFVALGEKYYVKAEAEAILDDDDDSYVVHSSLLCDMGLNILLRAQRLSILRGEGHGTSLNLSLSETILFEDVESAFNEAASVFKRSIAMNPIFAPAWCGLGCAVVGSDPLLAQHSLACALQLDKAMPDAWANLALLYASRNARLASLGAIQELTQVADTPMMWICRAAMLEREAVEAANDLSRKLKVSQAADAYRAAVQVVKEPPALLGISLTCRVSGSNESKKQSFGYMSEYLGLTSNQCVGAFLLHSCMTVEDCVNKSTGESREWKNDMIRNAFISIDQSMRSSESTFVAPSKASDLAIESKQGVVEGKLIGDLAHQVEKAGGEMLTPRPQNIQMQIILNPIDGTLWLALAKALAKDLSKMRGEKRQKVILQAIESTTLASERALMLLLKRMAKFSGDGGCVHAKDVADAFALSFWVKKASKELVTEMKKPPKIRPANGYDLQRAIMILPSDRLAREALKSP